MKSRARVNRAAGRSSLPGTVFTRPYYLLRFFGGMRSKNVVAAFSSRFPSVAKRDNIIQRKCYRRSSEFSSFSSHFVVHRDSSWICFRRHRGHSTITSRKFRVFLTPRSFVTDPLQYYVTCEIISPLVKVVCFLEEKCLKIISVFEILIINIKFNYFYRIYTIYLYTIFNIFMEINEHVSL